jgi:type I restriction enzyme, S subunit
VTIASLPDNWTLATLEDLVVIPSADIVDGPFGSNLKANEYRETGVPIVRLQNIDRNRFVDKNIKFVSEEKATELERHSFRAGDTVITKLGDPLGKAAIVPNSFERGIIVADIVRLRVDSKFANAAFVTYAINSPSVIRSLEGEVKGTTRPRVNLGHIRELKIPLAPLNEQKRIADKLDALLARMGACRERLDRVPLILKRFRQAVLAAATSGRLTEDWREANKQETSEWFETTVGEIAEVFLGRQRSPENHFGPHMRRYVRAANVTWNGWDFSDIKEMNFDPRDFERYRLQAGDILLNEGSGSADEVGKPAIWNGEIEDCCFQNTLLCVRPYETSSKYLYFALLHAARSRAFVKDTRGVNIFHIGKEKLAAFEITLPPLAEQHEIVRRVETIFAYADRLEARYRAARAQVERLTPSLLAKAFRGELVPQDPDDEPASVLLERIRAARAIAAAQPKQPRRRPTMEPKTTTKVIPAGSAGITYALQEAGRELSGKELLAAAGYPSDADAESVETFFVAVRDALTQGLVTRERRDDMDWFSLAPR